MGSQSISKDKIFLERAPHPTMVGVSSHHVGGYISHVAVGESLHSFATLIYSTTALHVSAQPLAGSASASL